MCAIFGVYNVRKAAEITTIGLHTLQHRAQDFAGIVSSDGRFLYREAGAGLVQTVFSRQRLDRLHGKTAIGHTRYPTVARHKTDNTRDNTQPIRGYWQGTEFALAHNGNLTNDALLKKAYPELRFKTTLDSEVIVRLLEITHAKTITEALAIVCQKLQGSFSLLVITPDEMVAVRDISGNRPLVFARKNGSSFVSSETCVFASIEVDTIREVEPGEMVTISKRGVTSTSYGVAKRTLCPFELVYYSHPNSVVYGQDVYEWRKLLGRKLEKLCPANADIVVPIPQSAVPIGMGYAESGRSGVLEQVITRNNYGSVGRSFIVSAQIGRDEVVDNKFGWSATGIKDKRIVLVDDSVVRSTTIRKVVTHIRKLGAKEVHVRVGMPMILHPCCYGINMRDYDELVAHNRTEQEIASLIGADSIMYMPLEPFKQLAERSGTCCFACLDGKYWHNT